MPEPDSPTRATVSPGIMSKEACLTAWVVVPAELKSIERPSTVSSASLFSFVLATRSADARVVLLAPIWAASVISAGSGSTKVLRGSSASRTASPMKISRLSIMAITQKAVMPSHGACRLALPCASISPSEGEPGGRPKPRKSSDVKVVMEPLRMNGMNVRVATIALGSRCLNMILALERPRARAARIYSRLRPRKNSARTTPTSATHENRSRIPRRIQKFGSMTAAMMIRR